MVSTKFTEFLSQFWNYCWLYIWNPLVQLVPLVRRDSKNENDQLKPLVKSVSEIPGPKGWPVIGDIRNFNNIGGSEKFIQYAENLHKEYGDIVKVNLAQNKYVFVSNPAHYIEVIRQEGTCPLSFKLPQTLMFEKIHKKTRGLNFQDGEQWLKSRSLLTKLLLKDTGFMEILFDSLFKPILTETVNKWANIQETHEVRSKIMLDCYELFLKGIFAMVYGKDYNKFLSKAGRDIKTIADEAIELNVINQELYNCPPSIARALGLGTWKRFEEILLTNIRVGHECTTLALESIRKSGRGGSLEEFGLIQRFKNIPDVTDEDIRIHCTDFTIDIPDASAMAILWSIYALGRNPNVQTKIREEISQVYKPGHFVLYKDLKNLPYLQAFVKEVFRMYPVAPFIARKLDQEMIIGGYKVPSGFNLVLSTIVSHNNPDLFTNSESFLPERWMKKEELVGRNMQNCAGSKNDDAYHPWGISKRSCAGQFIVSTIIKLVTASLVQKFQIESEEVQKMMKIILYPDGDMKIKLINRDA